jgi:hypothetical protein
VVPACSEEPPAEVPENQAFEELPAEAEGHVLEPDAWSEEPEPDVQAAEESGAEEPAIGEPEAEEGEPDVQAAEEPTSEVHKAEVPCAEDAEFEGATPLEPT